MTSGHAHRRAGRDRLLRLVIASCAGVLLTFASTGCRSRKSPARSIPSTTLSAPASAVTPEEQILLSGSFERVSRAVTGRASIVRRGQDFELKLEGVTVAQTGEVHVFLVGHERAATTRIVDDTEMKYDMAKLELGVPEQRIALPSEPDPALRSVVLFYPTFGVNLAVAPLQRSANGH